MKTRNLFLAIAAVLCGFALASCQRENAESIKVVEGRPVSSVSFSFSAPLENVEIVTKASNEVETNIKTFAAVFFKKGEASSKAIILTDGTLTGPEKKTETDYVYTLSFSDSTALRLAGIRSGEYYLYAVANYDKEFLGVSLDDLKELTKEEFDNYIIEKGNSDRDITENAIFMSGKYCDEGETYDTSDGSVTLQPGDNDFTEEGGIIHMRRGVAKIKMTISAADTVTFTPETYSICNYSRSSSLMDRSGWNGSDPDEMDFYGNASDFASAEDIPYADSIVFYMPENVQKAKNSLVSSDTYAWREAHVSAADQTFKNAPEMGTYVVIKGEIKTPTYSGNATYTVHLGDFSTATGSYDNFSVRRNYKYIFKIKITGVNSIATECLSSDYTEKNPGAEGNLVKITEGTVYNLDAHYEQVMISFNDQTISTTSLAVNTPYTSGTVIDNKCENEAADSAFCNWVTFVAPVSSTEFTAYNKNNTTAKYKPIGVYDLVKELKSHVNGASPASTDHFIVSDGKVYIQAFVNEYYYNGKDLRTFVNTDDRVLSLSLKEINVSPDKKSTLMDGVLFSLSQKSIKSPQNLNLAANPVGIETIEETTPTTLPTDAGLGSSMTEGWSNFDAILAGGGVTYGTTEWDTFVDVAGNGHLKTDATSRITSPMQDAYDNGYYQCLSRNRDENGNGVIDQDEIKWYLPAVSQYTICYIGEESLPATARIFQESLDYDSKVYATSTYGNKGLSRIYWSRHGVATGASAADSYKRHVRCARSLESYNGSTDLIVLPMDGTTEKTLSVQTFNANALRATYQKGEYPSHSIREVGDKTLANIFVVANKDLSITTTTTTETYTLGSKVTSTQGGTLSSGYYVFGQDYNADKTRNDMTYDNGSGVCYYASGSTYTSGATVDAKYVWYYDANKKTFMNASTKKYMTLPSTSDNSAVTTSETAQTLTTYYSTTSAAWRVGYAVSSSLTIYLNCNGSANGYAVGYSQAAEDGNLRSWCDIYAVTYDGSAETTTTQTEFALSDAATKDLCAENYYQKSDKSDLGLWRIPNDKEFYLMYLINDGGTTYFDTSLNYATRTQFSHGSSYLHFSGNNNYMTSHDDISVAHIRCVKDMNQTVDASYANGGSGVTL